jgi:hypothetical protein
MLYHSQTKPLFRVTFVILYLYQCARWAYRVNLAQKSANVACIGQWLGTKPSLAQPDSLACHAQPVLIGPCFYRARAVPSWRKAEKT